MDKEIIIDGVDISECSYAITPKRQCPNKPMPYAKETSCIGCKEHNTKLNFCKNNPDCYYKQLKRLERQYEDVLKLAKENADSNEYCLQELEQENEKLKEEITKLSDPRYQISKVNEGYYNRMNTYKQALQEIREICKNSHTSASEDYYRTADKIQAKINEVIGAE